MRNFKPWLLLILVFFAGIAVGVVGTGAFVRQLVRRIAANPDWVRVKIERSLDRELELSAEQRPKVHQIVADSHQRIKSLRREFQPRFLAIVEQAESEISTMLTPAQRERFQKWIKDKEAVWKPKLEEVK
jgi:hypothetical protein